MHARHIVVSLCVALAALSSCRRSDTSSTTTTTSSPYLTTNDEAVRRITDARCDRAAACGDVGARGGYASRDACAQEIGQSTRSLLDSIECLRGVDAGALQQCLSALEKDGCARARRAVDSVAVCRRQSLCAD